MGGDGRGWRPLIVLPDVNVLVYAFRRESSRHDRYRAWLADLVGGSEELALEATTLTGFLRVVTNHVFSPTRRRPRSRSRSSTPYGGPGEDGGCR